MKKKLVILVSGKLQSGKNQFAEYLKKYISKQGLSIHEDLFARSVKDGCREDFAELVKYLNANTPIQTKDENWYEDKTDFTRILLQIYGTDIFRKRVDTNWWVKKQSERIVNANKDVTIITDVRFPNEIDKLEDYLIESFTDTVAPYNLISVRINRNDAKQMGIKDHESEIALDNYTDFDYSYDNNGTLVDLEVFADRIAEETLIKNGMMIDAMFGE